MIVGNQCYYVLEHSNITYAVTFTADFASTQLSGTQISEFGLFTSGGNLIGSTWQREAFGSIVFDGTNELQIVSALHIMPG